MTFNLNNSIEAGFLFLDKPHNPMVNAGAIVISSLIKVNK